MMNRGIRWIIGTISCIVLCGFMISCEEDSPVPDKTTYRIATAGVVNGAITARPNPAKAGDKVTLTVYPAESYSYVVGSIWVDGGSIDVANAGGGKFTFKMPAKRVSVSCEFEFKVDPNQDGLAIGQAVAGKGTLVWRDEFNGTELDLNNWNFELGSGSWGWGNNEKQVYTNEPKNIRVQNGALIIEAKRDRSGNSPFSSARITTGGTSAAVGPKQLTPTITGGVTTGYVEVKAKMPQGLGFWPAVWMLSADTNAFNGFPLLGWPQCGEIDILETRGDAAVGQTIHYGQNPYDNTRKWQAGKKTYINTDVYHVYAVKWNQSGLQFFVDGEQTLNRTFPLPQGAMAHSESFYNDRFWFIIINLACGGTFFGNNGANGPDASLFASEDAWESRSLMVDWIRVYQ